MNEVRNEVNRWYDLMDKPDWDENTTTMWAMAEEIVRLRKERDNWETASERIADDLEKSDDEVERLRQELSNHHLPQRIMNAKEMWKEMGLDNDR